MGLTCSRRRPTANWTRLHQSCGTITIFKRRYNDTGQLNLSNCLSNMWIGLAQAEPPVSDLPVFNLLLPKEYILEDQPDLWKPCIGHPTIDIYYIFRCWTGLVSHIEWMIGSLYIHDVKIKPRAEWKLLSYIRREILFFMRGWFIFLLFWPGLKFLFKTLLFIIVFFLFDFFF